MPCVTGSRTHHTHSVTSHVMYVTCRTYVGLMIYRVTLISFLSLNHVTALDFVPVYGHMTDKFIATSESE